jgi:hypothetical protein
MKKLELRTHPKAIRASPKDSNVVAKRLRTEAGDIVTVRAISANSATFGNDLLYVFKQNVKKARKENRERFGSADRVAKTS